MNIDHLLRELARGVSGHYALVSVPWSVAPDPVLQLLEQLGSWEAFDRDAVVHIAAAGRDRVIIRKALRAPLGISGKEVCDRDVLLQLMPSDSPCIFVIDDFGQLNVDVQADWLSFFRSARESRAVPLRVICAGRWRPRAMRRFCATSGQPVSHGLDGNRIVQSERISTDAIAEWVAACLPNCSWRIQRCLAESVAIWTGRDGEIFGELDSRECRTAAQLERALVELAGRDRVQDIVQARLRRLSSNATRMLGKVVRYGALRADIDREEALEELWLEGLVSQRGDAGQVWIVPSLAVDAILRVLGIAGPSILRAEDCAPVRHAALDSAADLVVEIEGALRNFIMQGYVELQAQGAGNPLQQAPAVARPHQTTKRSVYNDACVRHDEDQRAPQGRFLAHPLSVQLEVADLRALLEQEPLRGRAERVFHDWEKFRSELSRFAELRNAVAHNKWCSVGAVEELEQLASYFFECLGAAAYQGSQASPGELVSILAESQRKATAGDDTIVFVTVENITDEDLHNVVIGVGLIANSSTIGKSESLPLRPRQKREVKILCRAREVLEQGSARWCFSVIDARVRR